ncbi:Radical SAM domain protein [Paenibacillus curdlanolyticus YK9]|uniref:Radical SAM domain protein n=1 Tax=Paenibacillus curdlanolyticus YK9 TaxID=717606 RepID=E0I3K2_9BACL|nr:radical SAM protein [Paenibacillus curdlanolyticus]EFM12866.1 Radical SAM domain protein [Paenibacillus curdlanolyticus YK9]
MSEPKRPSVRWLNPASGFLNGYSHTVNPYVGCTFGCSYCYVRRMPIGLFHSEPWGEWVKAKPLDEDKFRREWRREASKGPLRLFMASVTDPYQPMEHEQRLTRRLLELMAEQPPHYLLLQTRSPLVMRDIDILRELGSAVRVSMTVETDLEPVRKLFAPHSPPLAARMRALRELTAAGVAVQAAVSPLLPASPDFAEKLGELAPRIVVDDFFRGDGSGGKRTSQLKIRQLYEQAGLQERYTAEYADQFVLALQEKLPRHEIRFSQEGFGPD